MAMSDDAHTPAGTAPTDPEQADIESTQKRKKPPSDALTDQKRDYGQILSALGLQVFILVCMMLLSLFAAAAHGYRWPIPSAEDFARFDFIGVSPDSPQPSFLAIAVEVLAWSAFGVLARSEYYLTRLIIQHRDFRTLEIISKLVGDSAMGVSIAIAVVALLRSTEFVTLSLKSAGIDVIAAISFILGFYHEDTRRLLGTFRVRLTQKASESGKQGD
jgi:hypothetical protein